MGLTGGHHVLAGDTVRAGDDHIHRARALPQRVDLGIGHAGHFPRPAPVIRRRAAGRRVAHVFQQSGQQSGVVFSIAAAGQGQAGGGLHAGWCGQQGHRGIVQVGQRPGIHGLAGDGGRGGLCRSGQRRPGRGAVQHAGQILGLRACGHHGTGTARQGKRARGPCGGFAGDAAQGAVLLKIFGVRRVRQQLAGLPGQEVIQAGHRRGRGAGAGKQIAVPVLRGRGVKVGGIAQHALPDGGKAGDGIRHVRLPQGRNAHNCSAGPWRQ